MKMTTQVVTLAMCACLGLTMTSAQASALNGLPVNGLMSNGIPLNGMSMNGLILNGVALNALTVNGLTLNGVASNGVPLNGMPLNGLALKALPQGEPSPEAQYESFPYHSVSQKALGTTPPSRLGCLSLCSRYRLVPLCL